jgi:hypothetical protein
VVAFTDWPLGLFARRLIINDCVDKPVAAVAGGLPSIKLSIISVEMPCALNACR